MREDVKSSGVRLRNEMKFPLLTQEESAAMSESGGLLTSQLTSYTFMLRGFSSATSSAGGVINLTIPMDPSASGFNFAEWASLQSLFSEFKLVSFTTQFVAYYGVAVTGSPPIAIGHSITTASAPGSYGAVVSLPNSHFWSANSDRSAKGVTHRALNNGEIGWSSTSSVTAQPYAGAPGAVLVYGDNLGVSLATFKVLVAGVYHFRSRF